MHAPDALPLELTSVREAPQNDPIAPDIETASEGYTHRFAGEGGKFLLGAQARAVNALLDRIPAGPLRVLEVGGGHAQLTPLFAARGHHVAVQGSSAACFPRVRDVQERYPERVSCLLGSLSKLPAADEEYDLVCSIRLLGHLEKWREVLAEQCRTASRYVMCEFASPEGVQRLARALFRVKLQMEPDTRPFRSFEVEEVTDALDRNGFEVIAMERQLVLPIALHRRLGSPPFLQETESYLRRMGVTDSIGSPVVILAERRTRWSARNTGR